MDITLRDTKLNTHLLIGNSLPIKSAAEKNQETEQSQSTPFSQDTLQINKAQTDILNKLGSIPKENIIKAEDSKLFKHLDALKDVVSKVKELKEKKESFQFNNKQLIAAGKEIKALTKEFDRISGRFNYIEDENNVRQIGPSKPTALQDALEFLSETKLHNFTGDLSGINSNLQEVRELFGDEFVKNATMGTGVVGELRNGLSKIMDQNLDLANSSVADLDSLLNTIDKVKRTLTGTNFSEEYPSPNEIKVNKARQEKATDQLVQNVQPINPLLFISSTV